MQHRGPPHEINRVAVANRSFGKPVLNEEYGYEGDDHSPPNDHASVRHDHWALILAGAYGTYGDKTKGPKIGAYFSSTLEDSGGAVAPDSLRHIPALMGRTRWWEMTPLNELLSGCRREEVFCLARPGQVYLVYMTAGQDASLDLSHVNSGTLRGEWWDPRTGEVGPAFDRPRFEAGTGGAPLPSGNPSPSPHRTTSATGPSTSPPTPRCSAHKCPGRGIRLLGAASPGPSPERRS
jgi:hypothetical protein